MVELIKKLCAEKGITVSQLEKEAGLSNGSVSKWDRSSPSMDKLIKVADYFDVTLDYLSRANSGVKYENLVIPESLGGVGVAFHGGIDDLTQEDIDDVAEYVELLRKKRRLTEKAGNEEND